MSARDEFITSLRKFADWLEANPQAVTPDDQRFLLALSTNDAVEAFAAEHGLTVTVDDDGNASCDLTFGPIAYHAYGYADFAAYCAMNDERRARRWADSKGMEIRPAEDADPTA